MILVVHGPNLDRLGLREPALYGTDTLAAVDGRLEALGAELGFTVHSVQSNHEGVLIDRIHAATDQGALGFLVNPAGLGHTSVVLRDALLAAGKPFVEVHLTNPAQREPFRHKSLLSDVAVAIVAGFGASSYELGLRGLVGVLRRASAS